VSATPNDPHSIEAARSTDPFPPRAAYVHVPFCRHRCGYCDFALVAGRDDLVADYLAAIARELTRVDAGAAGLELATLYLGGGTPSHLGPDGLRRLFDLLHCGPLPARRSRSRPIPPMSRSRSPPRRSPAASPA